MSAQIRLEIGHHDEMEGPRADRHLTARAEVLLARGIGLDRGDGHPEKIAHASTAKIATNAITMAAMSAALFS